MGRGVAVWCQPEVTRPKTQTSPSLRTPWRRWYQSKTEGSLPLRVCCSGLLWACPLPWPRLSGSALRSIATTGSCRNNEDDWVLFGEVCDVHYEPTMRVRLRRTSLLLGDEVPQSGKWETFDIVCSVTHPRVDFSPGMLVGIFGSSGQPPQCTLYYG